MQELLNDAKLLKSRLGVLPPSAVSQATALVESFVIKYDDYPLIDSYSLGHDLVENYDNYPALEIRNDEEYIDLAKAYASNIIAELS